jgi:hypothetical protein
MKKIKNTIMLFLAFLTITFYLSSCGPDEDTRPTYHIDQTTMDYCIYDEGSWWVYEEESSQEIDTIIVKKVRDWVVKSDSRHFLTDGYEITYNSKTINQIDCWGGGDYSNPEINIFEESFVKSPHAYGDITFISTLDTSFIFKPSQSEQIKLKDTLQHLEIKDSTYQDIRIFENLIGTYTNYQKTIYWARHVGKIRVERADGSVWNLIAYKVSQDNL